MKCPFCAYYDTQVKDSRPNEDGLSIKRRRQCSKCNNRFTTIEKMQLREIFVVKKDGERKPFEREKILRSLNIALRKRNFNQSQIEEMANQISAKIESMAINEVQSKIIGELIMNTLSEVDQVAYVRFASVYREFRETKDFEQLLKKLNNKNK